MELTLVLFWLIINGKHFRSGFLPVLPWIIDTILILRRAMTLLFFVFANPQHHAASVSLPIEFAWGFIQYKQNFGWIFYKD